MKVQRINTKLIKPHTPTPPNLKNYKISFLDNSLSPMNLAVVLFYQSKPEHLEESLSKILVQFYPLAGRYIQNDHSVDCSDQGAEFVEAEALDIELIDLVVKPEAEQLGDLYPDQYFRSDEAPSSPLLSIQATHFPCGGLAIAISVSHRIFDVPALDTFIAAWSSSCNPAREPLEIPSFDLPRLLPLTDHDFGISLKGSGAVDPNKILVKRLLFNGAALASLKSEIRSVGGVTISGASVASAVLARALIRVDLLKHGKCRDFVVFQLVNMRGKTIPPQPKHACGNLCFTSLTPPHAAAVEAEGKIGIEELIHLMSDAVSKSVADHVEILSPDKDGREIIKDSLGSLMKSFQNRETNFLVFSDCTEFEFYEADFGRGKPVWIFTRPQRPRSNTVAVMGTKEGDGIEAWVYLYENDMRHFEQDEEIKSFII